MSQDVRQWLTEIKSLQQQLAALQQERDEAYASAANWRDLYETEAKQRRTDSQLAQQSIDALKVEMQQMQTLPGATEATEAVEFIRQEVEQIQGVAELRSALVRALMECDRLGSALRIEQAAHGQTRKALTTALGDTVDLLAKERATRKQAQAARKSPVSATPAANKGTATHKKTELKPVEFKSPSLELPQLE